MANKVGTLIKEARTGAKLTQEALAKQIEGLTAADISKAERGEKELTQTQLKQIAKITGVTQASLLNAAKESSTAKTSTTAAKKTGTTTTAKKTGTTTPAKKTGTTTTAKKTGTTTTAKKTGTTTTAKKTGTTTAAKKPSTATAKKETELKLTATEKKLVELYRAADKDTKEAAVKVLKGEKLEGGLLSLLSGGGNGLLDGAMDLLGLGKK